MTKVKVNEWQAGLVFVNGAYRKLLLTGTYWFWRNEKVYVFDITKPFVPPVELNILLQDQRLADLLQVVEVGDNGIVLWYENGLLKQVLTTGRYAFWKSVVKNEFVRADISKVDVEAYIDRSVLARAPVSNWVRSFEVLSQEKGLLFVDSRYVKLLEPGTYYFWRNSQVVQVVKSDMRQLQLEVNGQEILTRDKAGLRINAWARYRMVDIEKALLENKDVDKQLYVSVQLALRAMVSAYSLDELLENKEALAAGVLSVLKEKVAGLGVELSDMGIRDIILPGDMREIMNQVLVAEKKAQANSIMRREETASTRSLLNTAKLMEENNMLWKLKEMEYVTAIAEKISTISVSGNGALLEQLKQIFGTGK